MDYLAHIKALVHKAKYRQKHNPLTGYFEKHHVFPRAIQKFRGKNKTWWNRSNNIIRLTAKEHYIIHLLLWKWCRKFYGDKHKYTIKCMLSMLFIFNRCRCYNSKQYSKLKHKISKQMKLSYINGTLKIPSNKGKHHTEETKQKMSNANRGMIRTKELKEKISKSLIDQYKSGKRIHHNLNKKYSKKLRNKLSKAHEKYEYHIKINNIVVITKNLHVFCKQHKIARNVLEKKGTYKNYTLLSKNYL